MPYDNDLAYFEERLHLTGSRKLGWNSSYSQSYRYGLLVRDLDLRGKSCMLLGCGEGAGVPFLEARGCEEILGFDLVESNVREARKRYGRHTFAVVDGTADAFGRVDRVDYVIASGVWNVKTRRNPYEKVRELLVRTPQIRCGVATNFTCDVIGDYSCQSFDYLTILEMFIERFKFWKVDHTYFERDFSVWGSDPLPLPLTGQE